AFAERRKKMLGVSVEVSGERVEVKEEGVQVLVELVLSEHLPNGIIIAGHLTQGGIERLQRRLSFGYGSAQFEYLEGVGKRPQVAHSRTQVFQCGVKILRDHTVVGRQFLHRITGRRQGAVNMIRGCHEPAEYGIQLFCIAREVIDKDIEFPQSDLKVV